MDSKPETLKHREEVQVEIAKAITLLAKRAVKHDQSKLESPEVEIFDEYTDKLKDVEYPSPEYDELKRQIKPALDHHYKVNDHHPEYWNGAGLRAMSLICLMEMLCDWIAATKRTKNSNILKSIEENQKRFGYSDELKDILVNTVEELATLPA
jgi:hypothetical protein